MGTLALLLLCTFVSNVFALNLTTNSTLSDHGDPELVCRPAKWTDILVFYFGNYVAHAATTKSIPGQSPFLAILTVIAALLFPTSGVFRGVLSIRSLAIFAETELRTAARAGALCMVTRQTSLIAQEPETIRFLSSRIHGRLSLPSGWTLKTVPANATFEDDDAIPGGFWNKLMATFQSEQRPTPKLSYNYSLVKAIVALGQTLFAISTLYRTKGDQITRFGYAAFGLTVAPYAFMSLINLLGNLVCPEYPAMYIVENQDLRELRRSISEQGQDNEFFVDGVVGTLTVESDEEIRHPVLREANAHEDLYLSRMLRDRSGLLKDYFLICIAASIPLAIVGGISRFRSGRSTHAQRVWTMTWFVFGIVNGLISSRIIFFERWREADNKTGGTLSQQLRLGQDQWVVILMIVIYSAPALGGLVVVGQEIAEYGICMRIQP